MSKQISTIFILGFLFAAAAGCDRWRVREVESLLEARNAALQSGDASKYLSLFSKDCQDEFYPFNAAEPVIMKRFESASRPLVSFYDAKITIDKDGAIVTEGFSLQGAVDGRTRRYEDKQSLVLRRSDGVYRICSGSGVYQFLAGRLEEQDLIEQALDRRSEALTYKNLELYMTVVSPEFSHEGRSFTDVMESVRKSFASFDKIEHRSHDRKIWFFGNKATVQQEFNMEALLMDEPRNWHGVERFDMLKSPQGWQIVKGL